MKTLFNIKKSFSLLTNTLLVAFIILLAGTVSAQAPVNGKNKKADKIPHATLKEAKVTAPVITMVQEIEPMKIRLNVLNPTGEKVRINIYNFANEPVFQDAFNGREYNKILNFKITIAGRYSMHITGTGNSEVRRFKISSNDQRIIAEADLENKEPAEVMATMFRSAPTQIKLHIANNTGKPTVYSLRNEAKEVIITGSVSKAQFSKSFDMTEVPNGKYKFEVNYRGDKTATRTFDLQTQNERSLAWVDKKGRPLPPVNYSQIPLPSAPIPVVSIK